MLASGKKGGRYVGGSYFTFSRDYRQRFIDINIRKRFIYSGTFRRVSLLRC